MKGMFPQFDPLRDNDNKKVWEEAVFVFDTNCLLNLYRYRAGTRDQLIKVIEKISDRIWIPHYVALEFQRNRLKVILSQKKRFTEIREVISSAQNKLQSEIGNLQLERRHSLIDPSPLINGFKDLTDRFLYDLDVLQKSQEPITAHDPIKSKIEDLFENRVGSAPSEQKEVDELYKVAEKRYQLKIPPGYLDSKKDKDEPDEHYHLGIVYKRKFGDFIIWNQMLNYAKKSNLKSIVFVTDDGKEDWWWKINDEGPKTLGPRPELVDEAKHLGGITSFLMYKPEGFLENSRSFVDADVSKETIDEVRDVSRLASRGISNKMMTIYSNVVRAEQAVFNWISKKFISVVKNEDGAPDFIVKSLGDKIGFEVKFAAHTQSISSRIREVSSVNYKRMKALGLDSVNIVWVVEDSDVAGEVSETLLKNPLRPFPPGVSNIIGYLEDFEGGSVFVPFYGSHSGNSDIEPDIFG